MRTDFTSPVLSPLQTLSRFDPSERSGVARGPAPTLLSDLDRSGVIYKQGKHKDGMPAVGAPVFDLPGLTGGAAGAGDTPAAKHVRLEAQAKQLINNTFFGPMLKQMRESPFKSKLFDGGRGGEAFGQMLDQKLVDQMSRGAGKKLVSAVVRKFEARAAYAAGAADNRKAEDNPNAARDRLN
ncbi:MAG TPA: rod-binding protein, partial [Humisphaera sp.]